MTVENKTEEEINKLVRDSLAGQIFWGSMIPEAEWQHMIKSIFMPLAFLDKQPDDVDNWGDLYEYLDQAGPRAVNGYPCFFSFHVLSVHDLKIFREKVIAATKALDTVLKLTDPEPEPEPEPEPKPEA